MQLEARNISFRYNNSTPYLFDNFSLKVESGEKLCLYAPSGYGKTSLAMLLSGYLKPSKGDILLNSLPLPNKGICPVQLIFQHPENAINPRWKLRKVLEESTKLCEAELNQFGIESAWLDRYPRELSGGELQRFCIARALLTKPDFLICDEISTMLDVISQAQLWKIILDFVEENNIALISITHNLNLAQRVSDRIFDLSTHSYII